MTPTVLMTKTQSLANTHAPRLEAWCPAEELHTFIKWVDDFVGWDERAFEWMMTALAHMGRATFIEHVERARPTPFIELARAYTNTLISVLDEQVLNVLSMVDLCGKSSTYKTLTEIFGGEHVTYSALQAACDAGCITINHDRDEPYYTTPGFISHALEGIPTEITIELWTRHYTQQFHDAPHIGTSHRLITNLEAHPPDRITRIVYAYAFHHRHQDLMGTATLIERALKLTGDASPKAQIILKNTAVAHFDDLGWTEKALKISQEVLSHFDESTDAATTFQTTWYAFSLSIQLDSLETSRTYMQQLQELASPKNTQTMPSYESNVAQGYALWAEGRLALKERDYDNALRAWQASTQLANIQNEHALRLTSMEGRAFVFKELGQFELAQQLFESLRTQTKENHPDFYCQHTLAMAAMAIERNELAKSHAHLNEMLLHTNTQHTKARIWTHILLTYLAYLEQRWETATQHLYDAQNQSEAFGVAMTPIFHCLHALLHHGQAQHTQALEIIQATTSERADQALCLQWTLHILEPQQHPQPHHVYFYNNHLLGLLRTHKHTHHDALSIDIEKTQIRTPDRRHHDLKGRMALFVLIEQLIHAKQTNTSITAIELFEAAWPDISTFPRNGIRRVYTEIHRLRQMGITIETYDGGYRLQPGLRIIYTSL